MSYDPSKPYKTDIHQLIKSTWSTPYVAVRPGVYPLIEKKTPYLEVDHTDGIGTKGFYHWQKRTFKEAVLDAMAMNLNDLALMRARPYKIQNHINLPRDDHRAILVIVKELVSECKNRKIAITGGETSIHDNSDSLEISISMSGIVQTPAPNRLSAGQVLIGLPSNGLHSNGFSVVRKVFANEIRQEFTRSTRVYIDEVLKLSEKADIKGMMHITGGAFTKLKDLLVGADAIIENPQKPQPIFVEIYKGGISDNEMYKTFNCGTGFVIGVRPKDVDVANRITGGKVIGRVVQGSGKIKLTSAFSGHQIQY